MKWLRFKHFCSSNFLFLKEEEEEEDENDVDTEREHTEKVELH